MSPSSTVASVILEPVHRASTERRLPGDLVLLPVSIVSLVALLVNDNFLKHSYHNIFTGKLSDAAGIVLSPLLLASFAEVIWSIATTKHRLLSEEGLTACVIATGTVFGLTKVWTPAARVYRLVIATLEWPFFAAKSELTNSAIPGVKGTHLVHDLTDLLVLPLLALPWWFGRRRLSGR